MINNQEYWKSIAEYEDIYQISNFGRVKSLPRLVKTKGNAYRLTKERILKPNKDSDGYVIFGLSKEGVTKTHKGHQLVAKSFIENPFNYNVLHHKNHIRDDNNVENLEWCTVQKNGFYTWKNNASCKKLEINNEDIEIEQKNEIIPEEIWKPVIGCEKYYIISNHGNIKNIVKNTYLKPQKTNNGYLRITLSYALKERFLIHRLVAYHFIGNCDNLVVHHIDSDRCNNKINNLKIVSQRENIIYSLKNRTFEHVSGENNFYAKLKYNNIKTIKEMYSSGNFTQKEIGNKFNVSDSVICEIVNNKMWKS